MHPPRTSTVRQLAPVTLLLERLHAGDPAAGDALVPLVYHELHRLASQRLDRHGDGGLFQPTALVNEAWLRLHSHPSGFRDRCHFFGVAALAMQAILVDHVRRVHSLRRGGDRRRVPLHQVELTTEERTFDAMIVSDALERLRAHDPAKCKVAVMRFLLGCSVDETAEALGVSAAKVKKDGAFARAWMNRALRRDAVDHE